MKLNEMRQILTDEGIQLTKSLGQNFLHDGNQLERIIGAAEVNDRDRILEIGPGLGPLTRLLVEKAANVLAIEKDRRLFEYLKRDLEARSSLTLLCADALDYIRTETHGWAGWKVVSNLPYSVASPMLVDLARSPTPPERMVVTLQAEVARRLAAATDDEDYGILSLLIQRVFEPVDSFKIPGSCFFPVPEVESACVTLKLRPVPLLPPESVRTFEKIVKRGFSQRRKMMAKLLKADWPQAVLAAVYEETGLSPQIRAEKVSLEQFVDITQRLLSHTRKEEVA
jgi:16S rRNA (adenine1518-N6/adenine1519-N6)-dimethyltransferase